MEFRDNKPIYLQISDVICEKILSGELKAEDRLMSVREYGALIGVNPNTMMMALFNKCGMDVREVRLERVREIVGRNVTTCSELTKDEASAIIDVLQNGGNEKW